MSSDDVLNVHRLRKEYPGKKGTFVAVDDVSFSLKKGEILGLLGSNGAGKTTTIQMLLGTLTATAGEITYFGKDFFKNRSEILKQVVFASTYVSLPWKLTVAQNLEVFGRLYGIERKVLHSRIDELLDHFGIRSKKEVLVATLSAGQMTRLVLVKAFMVAPKVILLDEPTASLDPDMASDVRELILSQRAEYGTSILFTSHNMSEVAHVCDRALFLREGKVVADDVPEKLAKSSASSKLRLMVSDKKEVVAALAVEMGLVCVKDHHMVELTLDEAHIAHFLMRLAREGIEYSGIEVIEPTLEDYFLQMVRQ